MAYGRQRPESLEARAERMAQQLRSDNIRFTVHERAGDAAVPVGVASLPPDPATRTVGALRETGYWLGRVCDEVVMDDAPARSPPGPR
ncbi:hypothetical protein [Kitasatospora purpeofusca]|uniref:hypothetical protein n=1 Tax=Kitasatospora purpeofusca TaxID=67352 RepID=UPI00364ED143